MDVGALNSFKDLGVTLKGVLILSIFLSSGALFKKTNIVI
jgi:hypothetical protein